MLSLMSHLSCNKRNNNATANYVYTAPHVSSPRLYEEMVFYGDLRHNFIWQKAKCRG